MTVQDKIAVPARRYVALSHAQRGVWLDARMADDPTVYLVGSLAHVEAEIDPDLARQAVRMMMARHEGLRLRVDRDEPRQWIEPPGRPPFTFVDLSDEPDPGAAAADRVRAARREGLPLGEAPLFRVDLMRLGPARHRLLLLAHHLVADGVSMSLAQAYWLKAYRSLSGDTDDADAGEAAPDGTVIPRSAYVPVVEDDAAYEASPRYAEDMAYWRSRLDPLPDPLLAGRPAPLSETDDGAAPPALSLDAAGYERLDAAARRAGTTLHRALTALVAVGLGRRYRRRDFTLGLALHRREAASRFTIGMLAGVVPLRCRLDAAGSLGTAVAALVRDFDADMRHQRLPVDALSRELAAAGAFGDRADRSLHDVTVTMIPPSRTQAVTLGGRPVTLDPLRADEASPLTFYVDEAFGRSGLRLTCRHRPGVLDRSEAESLIAVVGALVEAFAVGADRPLAEIDGLGRDERRSIAGFSAGTAMPIPAVTLPDLFEARAAAMPEATAVVTDTGTLSFAALDAAADRVAARLRTAGVGAGDAVGVFMPRSRDTVVSLLGVLKAGAVYLPLDPAYPDERIAAAIADAGARVALVSPEASPRLPGGVEGIVLDDAWTLAGPAGRLARPDTTPESRAYVIYTSGSTGRPKGVAVSHRALVNLARARLEHDPIGPGDRILAAISVGFDVSLGQLLTPLLAGASVVVAGDIRGASAAAFWDFLVRHGVTHVNSVPSFFETVLDGAPEKTALKRLMLGGEPLSGALADRLRRRLGVPVWNMYGPTEACIDATAHAAPESGGEAEAVLPIGRPLPNYTCHVLDDALEPVGIGHEGELCIGGASLAEGYLGMPEATAERFVEHPDLGRLYRTGDRAHWRRDGVLVFLGRSDTQVKIRGFRVEPGEVEARLALCPGVARAAVVARRNARGETVLVGYVVPADARPAPVIEDLRAFLAERLPAHMMPSAFVVLDDLPLTPNGKLDTRALPEPEIAAAAGAPPSTATEVVLAGLFATLLGVGHVDTASHFFELGGHSLLATQLATRLREALGVEVPIRTLFEAPRLADLAGRIDALLVGSGAALPAAPRLEAGPRPEPLPLSYEQERLWFLHKLDPASPAYNIPVAFRLDGPLDLEALRSAFRALVARHEVLRTRFAEVAGVPCQRIRDTLEVPFRVDDLTGGRPDRAMTIAREEATAPFDLTADPLLRVRILRMAPETHVALVTMHHIVSDGWSVAILQNEIAAHYVAARSGTAAPLPALAVQYADYAVWQRRRLDADAAVERVAFWKRELAGAPEMLTLPLDHPRPARRKDAGSTRDVGLTPDLSACIADFARARGATPFIVVTAAWAALMARWSGQDDVVIGAPIANRGTAEVEPLIGFFVNTVALRADLAGAPGFAALVDRLRARALDAYGKADLPFEQVVDALKPARVPGVNPLFQTVVAYQAAPASEFVFGDVRATAVPMPESAAKFDLSLVVEERADGLSAGITYALDLFLPRTVQRLAEQFRRLLEAALAEPERPVAELPLTGTAEEAALVEASRPAALAGTRIDTIPALFQATAAARPEAEAVRFGAVSLDFATLNRRANRLAHVLLARGVRPGRPVAVVLTRSEALVVAALGIMKAGGVYMPVDPAHPAERIAGMLDHAGPALVLVEEATAAIVGPEWPRLVPADWVADRDDDPTDADRAAPLTPASPAYVIHTSGSTGRPKGVVVGHGALAHLAAARHGHDPIGPGDRVLATLSVSFDVSVGQLVTPLLAGATVVVSGEVGGMTAAEFWALMEREGITHLNSGPAFLDAMLETAPPPLELKRLMLGGEAFPTALARKIRAALPATEIFNMYGPTETCIDATAYRFRGDETAATLPIGRAMPGYRVIVLDPALRPVPAGVPGEIHIGGPSVAIGYLGRPEETAARFVADPFGAPGDRLYRTGDLARLNARGDVEFLGRADGQVKIRGFRIELEEIAAVLRGHAGIRSATVTTIDRGGEPRLVAYVVANGDDATAAVAGWRDHAAALLPGHMIPDALVTVPTLPTTVNGKLDLRALPAPDFDAAEEAEPVPARHDLDETLLDIWRTLLGTGRIGIDHNFFRLGGHSLQALRLAAACKPRLRIELPIAAIYRHQTVRDLADAIRSGAAFKAQGPLVQLSDGPGRPVFCFHPVGGAAFGYMGLAEALAGSRPVFGVQASGLEAGEPLAESLDAMVTSYMAAMKARQPEGPYAMIGHSFGGLAAFEIARRLEAEGETVDRLVMIDTSPAGEPWTMDMARYTAHRIVRLERERAGSAAPIDPAQEQRVTDIVANNMRLSESYVPTVIGTPLVYLLARRGDTPPNGRREYWEAFSKAPEAHPPLNCDHFAVLNRDNARTLAVFFE